MEYLKIVPNIGLTGIVQVTKYKGIIKTFNYSVIENVIQSIFYDESNIKFYRYKYVNKVNIQGEFTVEHITRKEYYDIVKVLKERRITDRIEQKEPYMVDVPNSTITNIKFIPKPGFEVGYRKITKLEYFASLGAAYPMADLVPFTNSPYEVKVDKRKYKGYKFIPEESSFEKSVYKVVWPSNNKFKKACEFFYL